MGQLLKAEIQKEHQAKIDGLKELLGSDLTADIYGLTVFGSDSDEANATALIHGRFDRQKLLALLALNSAYSESTHGDKTLYHWIDDKRGKDQVGAFAAENLIVISQREGVVKTALDIMGGKGESLAVNKNASLYALTEGTQGAIAVAAAEGLSELAKDNEHAAILHNSKMMIMIADEAQTQMRLFVQLEANSVEAAQQVEQIARGMLAFASLQQEKHPEIAPLLKACSLSRTDASLSFEFRYVSADLFALMKRFAPKEITI